MSLFGIVTGAIGLGAEFGLTSLIGNVAATVTTKSGNKLVDKICIGIGTAVLAGMAGEAANNYIKRQAEELKESVTKALPINNYEDEFDVDFDDEFFEAEKTEKMLDGMIKDMDEMLEETKED